MSRLASKHMYDLKHWERKTLISSAWELRMLALSAKNHKTELECVQVKQDGNKKD